MLNIFLLLSLEMEAKEERKGSGSFADFAHARAKEAHLQAREEVSQNTDINLPDKIASVEEYLANLPETYSMASETIDSSLWSLSAPSESEIYQDTGNFIVVSCYLLEWIPRE